MSQSILVVDDEPDHLAMVCRLMGDAGTSVEAAESAEKALDVVSRKPIDLVVTDLKMPGMDGLSLAEKLLEQDPNRPVILMTAHADLESARKAVAAGLYDYVTKPFDIADLLSRAKRALAHRRMFLEIQEHQRELETLVKERSRKLDRAYGELVQTEKLSAVGRLAAGVVHEVLNPIAVAVGRIDMVLADEAIDAPHRNFLKIAREELDRAVKIMLNLRDFARERPSVKTPEDLNALVTQTLELLTYEVQKRSVEVVMRLESLPAASVDRDQISQLLLNLIRNAIDAMPNGGRLTVATRAFPGDGRGSVEVRVIDTGEGMDESEKSRIFEPFFTTKGDGSGLGLPICQGIAEAHGGRIEVESRPGDGTTFSVKLPVTV